jgi:hypothetical protein
MEHLWWFAGGLAVGLAVAYVMHWMSVKLAGWDHCPICKEAGVDYCLEEEEE